MSDTASPVIMTCFARSGGTLLNQCLSALPNTMIFSEISPFRSREGVPHLKSQASDWYDIQLRSSTFRECIQELITIAGRTGKYLILRDWPVRCFEGSGKSGDPSPPNRLVLPEYLPPGLSVKSFAFLRDAYDVYLSRKWGLGFPKRYLKYVEAVQDASIPIFLYEDFCRKPGPTLQRICDSTGLQYDPVFLETFESETKVTGDISLGAQSRGRQITGITVLQRRFPLPQRIHELAFNPALREANRRMGYPTGYFQRPIAWPWQAQASSISG